MFGPSKLAGTKQTACRSGECFKAPTSSSIVRSWVRRRDEVTGCDGDLWLRLFSTYRLLIRVTCRRHRPYRFAGHRGSRLRCSRVDLVRHPVLFSSFVVAIRAGMPLCLVCAGWGCSDCRSWGLLLKVRRSQILLHGIRGVSAGRQVSALHCLHSSVSSLVGNFVILFFLSRFGTVVGSATSTRWQFGLHLG